MVKKRRNRVVLHRVLLAGLLLFSILALIGCPPPGPGPDVIDEDITEEDLSAPHPIKTATTSGSNDPCETSDDCPDSEVCFEEAGQCRTPCEQDLECPDTSTCDAEEGVCVQCENDDDCAFGVCHPSLKTCVLCADDDDCDGIAAACHPEAYICVQCTEDTHCPLGVCDQSIFQCVECVEHEDCEDEDECTLDVCVDRLCRHPTKSTAECQEIECLVAADCDSPAGACVSCEDFRCIIELETPTCVSSDECAPNLENPCLTPICEETSCGGAECGLIPIDGCLSCTNDEDCGFDSTEICRSSCDNEVCVFTEIGDEGCECVLDSQCPDDGNICTDILCDVSECVTVPTENDLSCDDGDECTKNDICVGGACLSFTLITACGGTCETDNDCPLNSLGCSGECGDGVCLYPPDGGKCPECTSKFECQDDNPCTKDECSNGICISISTSLGGTCDDGNECTADDTCVGGQCVGTEVDNCGAECVEDADCPFNPDQICSASCIDGICVYLSLIDECPVDCPVTNACQTASCVIDACGFKCETNPVPGCTLCDKADDCGDGNSCTLDKCDNGVCANEPQSGTDCNIDTACGSEGQCFEGICLFMQSFTADQCDDGNPCSADSCDPATGCVNTSLDGNDCDDGDECTVNDSCEGKLCGGKNKECSDADLCNGTEVCDPITGDCLGGLALECADDNVCNGTETCNPVTGSCDSGEPLDCDDDDVCTSDACLDSFGCIFSFAADVCNDNNPCTTDGCNPSLGCFNEPFDGLCDDGDPCTTQGNCVNGECHAGAQLVCPATSNLCAESTCIDGACQLVPVDGNCDDGDPCTANETCYEGQCNGIYLASCFEDLCVEPYGGICDEGELCADGSSCTCVSSCPECDDCAFTQCVESSDLIAATVVSLCQEGNLCPDDFTCTCFGSSTQEECLFGACLPNGPCPECSIDNDCKGAFSLCESICFDSQCVLVDQENECQTTSDCDAGATCTDTACGLQCIKNQQPVCEATDDGDICGTDGPCTIGFCEATGCVYSEAPDSTVCESENGSIGKCVSGICAEQLDTTPVDP